MKRKLCSLLLALSVLCGASACSYGGVRTFFSQWFGEEGVAGGYELHATETRVVIIPQGGLGEVTLLDYMERAKLNGGFDFEIQDGMITSINGKANAADFSSCWMLYTSDVEFSNTDWGTVEYEGETLGSAIVGAEFLPATTGAIYLWEYCTF